MKSVFIFSCILQALLSQAQQQGLLLRFQALYQGKAIQLHTPFRMGESSDSLLIESFRFYLSNLKLSDEKKVLYAYPKKHVLVDLDSLSELRLALKKQSPDKNLQLQFILGIDSTTQAAGALGQDLDPVNGMYWTWQSGYIHLKLEGKRILKDGKREEFHYHIGGYRYPFNTVQSLSLNTGGKTECTLHLELSSLLQEFLTKNEKIIMQPGEKAVRFSKIFSQSIQAAN